MTIIEQIKAEIERRKSELKRYYNDDLIKFRAYDEMLSILSTIESEKPMNMDEELNEEIKKEKEKLPFFLRGKDLIAFARHFAQWGAEHTPLPEDTVLFNKGVEEGRRLEEEEQADLFTIVALDAAQRAKEQMMKEAVEGETVCVKDRLLAVLPVKEFQWTIGDKVRIIILPKEAEQ